MKSIESRLSAVERTAAKTENVIVEFKDSERSKVEMDLLKATKLLLRGSVRCITAKWKHGEQEKYEDEDITRVRKYMDDVREKYAQEKEQEKECREKNCEIYHKYCKYPYTTGV